MHYVAPQFHPDYNTKRAGTATPQSQRHVTQIPGVLVHSLLCLLFCIASYSFVPIIYTGTVKISFAECFTHRSWYDPDGFTHIVHLLTCILPHLWAAVPCYFVATTSWNTVRRVSWLIFKVATWCVLSYHTDNAHEFAGLCSSINMQAFAAKATSTSTRKPPPAPTDSSLYADSDYEFIIMDSGCTTPILNDPQLFHSLKPSTATVHTADKTEIAMQQEGPADIVVLDQHGTEHNIHLPCAFLCTDMHKLLSVKQLVCCDHSVTFNKRGSTLDVNGHTVPLYL